MGMFKSEDVRKALEGRKDADGKQAYEELLIGGKSSKVDGDLSHEYRQKMFIDYGRRLN